jgi:hypothetical protein
MRRLKIRDSLLYRGPDHPSIRQWPQSESPMGIPSRRNTGQRVSIKGSVVNPIKKPLKEGGAISGYNPSSPVQEGLQPR